MQPVILIAEDDEDDFMLWKEALIKARADLDVRWAANGQEVMDYLRKKNAFRESDAPRPSFILMDLNMPFKDGRETLKEIKADPELRVIPVVILTTSLYSADVDYCYKQGANSVMTKPIGLSQVMRKFEGLARYWLEATAPIP